jgi:hypothetical protein
MNYCCYYQAIVKKDTCWYLTAILRSYEHLAFDRTINVDESRFEFFVAPQMKHYFLTLMDHMQAEGIVSQLQELPNRLADPKSQL